MNRRHRNKDGSAKRWIDTGFGRRYASKRVYFNLSAIQMVATHTFRVAAIQATKTANAVERFGKALAIAREVIDFNVEITRIIRRLS